MLCKKNFSASQTIKFRIIWLDKNSKFHNSTNKGGIIKTKERGVSLIATSLQKKEKEMNHYNLIAI